MAQFGVGKGRRPHIRIEVSFRAPAVAPIERPIRSMIAAAAREPAEVAAFPCIDIVDFKVAEPPTASASAARRTRSIYRERMLDALTSAGFGLEDMPHVGNENRFFAAEISRPRPTS
jgi:hypothetical protein